MLELSAYRKRFDTVMMQVTAYAREAGRDPDSIRLLPVSKTHPLEALRALIALGIREFGENYAQEMATKATALGSTARFVFIGTLQSNKIKLVVRHASEIQSVGSLRHAKLVAAAARECGKVPYPIYLLVNAGDEASKSGLAMTEVIDVASSIASELPDLDLQGIMAIPPPLKNLVSPADLARPQAPPLLYEDLGRLSRGVGRGQLSLGMSQDLKEAIYAGSSCVRVGTALFGPRG